MQYSSVVVVVIIIATTIVFIVASLHIFSHTHTRGHVRWVKTVDPILSLPHSHKHLYTWQPPPRPAQPHTDRTNHTIFFLHSFWYHPLPHLPLITRDVDLVFFLPLLFFQFLYSSSTTMYYSFFFPLPPLCWPLCTLSHHVVAANTNPTHHQKSQEIIHLWDINPLYKILSMYHMYDVMLYNVCKKIK